MDNFLYYIDGKPYLVLVKYKKIKTIRIKIEFDTIEVNCNNLVSNDKIVEVLNRNNDWLKKKIKSNEKIKKINEQFKRGEYIHDVTMPEIKMLPLILKSLLLTFWNVLIICVNFLA